MIRVINFLSTSGIIFQNIFLTFLILRHYGNPQSFPSNFVMQEVIDAQ